jgi:PmbA protein
MGKREGQGHMNEKNMVAQAVPDRDYESAQLALRVEEAISEAGRGGVDGVEATASMHLGLSVTVRMGEVETLEHNRDRGIGVTVFVGRSKGHASSADLRRGSVKDCVRRAIDIARFTQEDSCNGLAEPELLATAFPDLDLWHPRLMEADEAIRLALGCEAAGRADERISNSEGANVSTHAGVSVYGNSNGFMGQSSGTRYDQSCVLIAGEGDAMQRDYWYDSRRAFPDLEPVEETGRTAAERTVRRLGARKVPTCQAPVLFSPEVARGLLGHLISAVSGAALYRNASFLKDSAGEQLFPDWLAMTEKPFLPRGSGSTAFDGEGVATKERNIVENGVLTGYVLSSYSARRLGLKTTGNAGGVHNLCVGGKLTPAGDLVAGIQRGLLVTEVMGQGVSIVTGDYSRGASGFWVENGEIAYPVEEVTIAGHLRDMFAGVQAAGDDLDDRSNIQSGTILIGDMTIAGS